MAETHFGAAARVEGRFAGAVDFDTWLGRGAHSVAETHFGAAVRGEAPSAGSTYFDPWLRCGARSVGPHSCARLWTEARGTRVEPDGSPAMGQTVLVSSRFDAPTSAKGL